MDSLDDARKNEILYYANRCLYFNKLIIEQCDTWLSAEEGNANMIRSIEERKRKEREDKKNYKL